MAMLRIRALLGKRDSKIVALVIALMALGIAIVEIDRLSRARNAGVEPIDVEIKQLVAGEIPAGRYVRLSGSALFPPAYEEMEGGRLVAEYYYVENGSGTQLIVVRAAASVPAESRKEPVTVTGLTHSPDSHLASKIQIDKYRMADSGRITTPRIYVAEGEEPGSALRHSAILAGLAFLVIGCVASLALPGSVFRPAPVSTTAPPGMIALQASGRFAKLESLEPTVQIGRRRRTFERAPANLHLSAEGLTVWIPQNIVLKVSGLPVWREKSQWAVPLEPSRVDSIDTGKLIGARECHDCWAVRSRYRDDRSKPRELILGFSGAGQQAAFLKLLTDRGFAVRPGEGAEA